MPRHVFNLEQDVNVIKRDLKEELKLLNNKGQTYRKKRLNSDEVFALGIT